MSKTVQTSDSRHPFGAWLFIFVGILACSTAFGQISMSLSAGSGSPGTGVVLNLSMADPSNTQPASLQWVMTYPTTDFSGVVVAVAGTARAPPASR